ATTVKARASRRIDAWPAADAIAVSAAATRSATTTGTRTRFASANPMQSAPTNACGRRKVTSRDHQSLQLSQPSRADNVHAFELGDRVKRTVRLPVVQDLLRRHRTDARQPVELLRRRSVEVEWPRSRGAGTRRGRRHTAGTAGRNDDLLTVGHRRR